MDATASVESLAYTRELCTLQFESWVFGLFLLERFPSLLIDSGSTLPFGKEWKIFPRRMGKKMDARNLNGGASLDANDTVRVPNMTDYRRSRLLERITEGADI